MQSAGTLTSSPEIPAVLTYDFKNTQPIELLDLTASLTAVGEQFRKFMRDHGDIVADEDIRLFVKEVREGSIIAELMALARQYTMVPPDLAWVVQFAEQLQQFYEFFKGREDLPAPSLDKADFDRLSQIVDPVAKDSGAQLNIFANDGAPVDVNLHMTSTEANAVQNRLRRYRDRLPDQLTGIHEDQVLYWYQVRDDAAQKPGDRAVIPRVSPRPVKVQFASEAVKVEMIDRPENPFRLLYIVDVDITEIDNKPVLYKILIVKDTMERERT